MTSKLVVLAAGLVLACKLGLQADDLIGNWALVSIVSPDRKAEVGPTNTPPIVHITTETVSGSDGCNDWSGTYTVPEEAEVKVGRLARTLRMCFRFVPLEEGGYDGAELEQVTRFERTGNALVLSSDDGQTRLTFRLP